MSSFFYVFSKSVVRLNHQFNIFILINEIRLLKHPVNKSFMFVYDVLLSCLETRK
jgi:hypothetical protein